MSVFEYENDDVPQYANQDGDNLDLLWMMCHALKVPETPMWVGFNSQIAKDPLPKQKVLYMPNLRHPITGLDVIQETLNITQHCADDIGQKYGIVTYDLNAAKPAFQMQVTEIPKYDRLFIMPGPFHLEMSFFKALGRLINESGGPAIINESGVLAPGSLKGFLSGKNFNRCKRIHPMYALDLETLHLFESRRELFDEVHLMNDKES